MRFAQVKPEFAGKFTVYSGLSSALLASTVNKALADVEVSEGARDLVLYANTVGLYTDLEVDRVVSETITTTKFDIAEAKALNDSTLAGVLAGVKIIEVGVETAAKLKEVSAEAIVEKSIATLQASRAEYTTLVTGEKTLASETMLSDATSIMKATVSDSEEAFREQLSDLTFNASKRISDITATAIAARSDVDVAGVYESGSMEAAGILVSSAVEKQGIVRSDLVEVTYINAAKAAEVKGIVAGTAANAVVSVEKIVALQGSTRYESSIKYAAEIEEGATEDAAKDLIAQGEAITTLELADIDAAGTIKLGAESDAMYSVNTLIELRVDAARTLGEVDLVVQLAKSSVSGALAIATMEAQNQVQTAITKAAGDVVLATAEANNEVLLAQTRGIAAVEMADARAANIVDTSIIESANSRKLGEAQASVQAEIAGIEYMATLNDNVYMLNSNAQSNAASANMAAVIRAAQLDNSNKLAENDRINSGLLDGVSFAASVDKDAASYRSSVDLAYAQANAQADTAYIEYNATLNDNSYMLNAGALTNAATAEAARVARRAQFDASVLLAESDRVVAGVIDQANIYTSSEKDAAVYVTTVNTGALVAQHMADIASIEFAAQSKDNEYSINSAAAANAANINSSKLVADARAQAATDMAEKDRVLSGFTDTASFNASLSKDAATFRATVDAGYAQAVAQGDIAEIEFRAQSKDGEYLISAAAAANAASAHAAQTTRGASFQAAIDTAENERRFSGLIDGYNFSANAVKDSATFRATVDAANLAATHAADIAGFEYSAAQMESQNIIQAGIAANKAASDAAAVSRDAHFEATINMADSDRKIAGLLDQAMIVASADKDTASANAANMLALSAAQAQAETDLANHNVVIKDSETEAQYLVDMADVDLRILTKSWEVESQFITLEDLEFSRHHTFMQTAEKDKLVKIAEQEAAHIGNMQKIDSDVLIAEYEETKKFTDREIKVHTEETRRVAQANYDYVVLNADIGAVFVEREADKMLETVKGESKERFNAALTSIDNVAEIKTVLSEWATEVRSEYSTRIQEIDSDIKLLGTKTEVFVNNVKGTEKKEATEADEPSLTSWTAFEPPTLIITDPVKPSDI